MPLVSRTFDQLIDFTRTSSATFVGSNGLIQSTPESRNLLTFTQEFDNAAWTKANTTVTANSTTAPDGTSTADTLTASAGAGSGQQIYQALTSIASGNYVYSIYAKQGSGATDSNLFLVRNQTTGVNPAEISFNYQTGVVTQISGSGATAANVGGGWWRLSIPFTLTATLGDAIRFYAGSNGAVETPGEFIYVWGAQLELGSTATDYTRNFGGLFPPRFDYDPVTLAPRGLLIEEQRTNLLTRSEDFDSVSWVKSGVTVTSNATASPAGALTADKIAATVNTGGHTVTQIVNVTSGTTYTASVFLKAAGLGYAFVLLGGSGFPTTSISVDLSTGAVSTAFGTPLNATSAQLGSGWWRVSFSLAATSTTTATAIVYTSNDGVWANRGDAGDGTSGIFLWGAQLEAGAFATSYIPTVASQVTRTADTALIQAPNFAPWYNQSEGTVVAEYDILGFSANQRMFSLNDNTVSNEAALYSSTGSNRLIATAAGVAAATPIGLSPITAGVVYTSALGFKLDDFGIAVNGNAAVTDNSGAMPSGIVKLNLGSNYLGSGILNGHLRSIRYYPVRLSDAQLQALTA